MPTSVRAVGCDSIVNGIAVVAFITVTFDSGIVVNVELGCLGPSKRRRTVLIGSERTAIYDDGPPEPVRLDDHGVVYRFPETFGEYHLACRNGNVISPKIESHELLSLKLGDFVNAIRTGERMKFHTALTCSVVRLVDAAEQSQRHGGREVFLEQDDAGAELAAVPGLAGR